VDHYRPGEGWIHCLDFFEELEHTDGGEGNSKVRPAGEVKLGDQTGSLGSITGLLYTDTIRNRSVKNNQQQYFVKF